MKPSAGLFNQIYLVQRCDAAGNDFQTQEAVFDTIAQHVAADICLPVGGKLSSLQMNDVTRQSLSTCPDTKLPRHFSTLSSTALVLPRNRLVRNATTRQMTDMLSIVVLGNGKALDHADADVDAWLVEVNLEERRATR